MKGEAQKCNITQILSGQCSVWRVEGKDKSIQFYLRLWLLWRLCLRLVLGLCLGLENIINQISDSTKGIPPVWTSRQRNSKSGLLVDTHAIIIMTTEVLLHSWEKHMYRACTAAKTTGIERKKDRVKDRDSLVSAHWLASFTASSENTPIYKNQYLLLLDK